MEVKGYVIEDTGDRIAVLDRQGMYKSVHTGDVFTVGAVGNVEIPVKEWDDLVYLRPKRFVNGYLNTDTEVITSVEEYKTEEYKLLSKSTEEYGELIWNTLEDEFNYRKFKSVYTPIYKEVYEEVEVVVKNVKRVLIDTGNEFIKPLFCEGHKYYEIDVYKYDRDSATKKILSDKMEELGVRYVEKGFGLKIGEREWSNSKHSGIRFAKLDSKYIFNSRHGEYKVQKGSLEKMKRMYEEDSEEIRYAIDKCFKTLYGTADNKQTDLIKQVLGEITSSITTLSNVNPYRKSEGDYFKVLRKLEEIERKLVNYLE